MIGLPDCHAHLAAVAARGTDLRGLAHAWREAGVGLVLSAGTDLESSHANLEVAWSVPTVLTCVGIGPAAVGESGITDAQLAELAEIAAEPVVAGIGEIGLDISDGGRALDVQQAALGSLLRLARDEGYAVFIHCAAPVEALLEVWRGLGSRRPAAVVTSFGGDADAAAALCGERIRVSIGAGGTPANDEVVRAIPDDLLLLNSDAGAANGEGGAMPAAVADLAERVASVRAVSGAELHSQVERNLRALLRR